jgi:hypothetical protein
MLLPLFSSMLLIDFIAMVSPYSKNVNTTRYEHNWNVKNRVIWGLEATSNGLHNITINTVLTNYSGEKTK